MSIDNMTPREAYSAGYNNGESSLLADVNTLCDQLDIELDGRHEFEAIRAEVLRLRRERDDALRGEVQRLRRTLRDVERYVDGQRGSARWAVILNMVRQALATVGE